MDADRRPERVLVVTAHPDDVDFAAAGTVAQWTSTGVDVRYCIITDGDAGGSDPSVPRVQMAATRRAEQTAAAAVLGVTDLTFLGYPDGRLVPSIELRRDISRVIRTVRPDVVVCQSPERNWQSVYASHPDHLAAGEAAMAAVYPDARNEFAHPDLLLDGFAPWAVGEVWVMAPPKPPNRTVDITDHFDQKLEALHCHVSQHPDPAGLEGRLRPWNAANAEVGGLPEGRLAELFLALDTA